MRAGSGAGQTRARADLGQRFPGRVSKQVRNWLRQHNHAVLQDAQTGKAGVRIIACWLPIKSPWLNSIEPKWVHGKRAIVEPARILTAKELRQRVCDSFDCEQTELLTQHVSS
jgi:hypothetical protein